MYMPDDVDDGSSSFRLFNKLYRVEVPKAFTMCEAEINFFGQPVTGIKHLDKYLANEMCGGLITTVRLAYIISEGGCFSFKNVYDAKDCYTDLYQHLLNWRLLTGRSHNVRLPPEEDIEMLQDLLEVLEVYKHILDDKNADKFIFSKFAVINNHDSSRKPQRNRLFNPSTQPRQQKAVILNSWEDMKRASEEFNRR